MIRLAPAPLTRVAAACALTPIAVAVQSAAPVAAAEPALVRSCVTATLPFEEVKAGATSEIRCEWVEQGEWVGVRMRTPFVATHYDNTNGFGGALTVTGTCGESISFGAGDSWNNAIASTRHQSCGNVKHFDYANLSGESKVTTGGLGILWPTLGTMQNRTSSVGYGA